jgi:2'-5' RNA ligase
MPRHRLGVVLLLESPLADEVDGLRRACGDGSLGRIPAHVTLVPPVNVPADRLEEALAVLRVAASATAPFEVTVGPVATFHPVTPVLYLAVGGDGAAELVRLRDRVFTGPLTRRLTHPFVPHVTLADGMAPERIDAACRALCDYRSAARFDRVHLLAERPGRVWEPLADAPFGAPAVVARGELAVELQATSLVAPDAAAFLQAVGCPGAVPVPSPAPAPGPRRPLVVTARRSGRVVGVAAGAIDAGTPTLEVVVVDPACRGEGVGDHLVDAFRTWAPTGGQ